MTYSVCHIVKMPFYDRHFVYIKYLLQKLSYFSTIVFKRSKFKELSTEELIGKLLYFENLNNLTKGINDLNEWSDKENEQLHFKLWSYFFLSCRFPKLAIHYYTKKIIDLERSSLGNTQYLRREMIEISPDPFEL